MLPACLRHGLGTMVYSPLGGGVLTGKYRRGEAPPADSRASRSDMWSRMLDEQNLDIAEAVGKVAAELGVTPTAVSIAWVPLRISFRLRA